jgi:iron complex outermembrane receptor protein
LNLRTEDRQKWLGKNIRTRENLTMTGNVKRKWVMMSLLSGTALTLCLPDVALAQADGQEVAKDGATQERNVIVVTATRREESIIDVPYNISAISGDTIEAAKTFDSAELLRSVPGVGVVAFAV